MMMIATIIDDERLERLEQQLRGILDADRAIPLLTHDATQLLEHKVGAGSVFAAQDAAFKLADQQRTRSWRKFAQKSPQPLDGRFAARHLRICPNSSL